MACGTTTQMTESDDARVAETAAVAIGGAVAGGGFYLGLVTGAVPIDLGVGRRLRELGPLSIDIDAPAEEVFDVLAEPYADRASRAMQNKVRVLERSQDLVLAAHYTPIRGRLRATTVETVRFDRPGQIGFRLVRGPVRGRDLHLRSRRRVRFAHLYRPAGHRSLATG